MREIERKTNNYHIRLMENPNLVGQSVGQSNDDGGPDSLLENFDQEATTLARSFHKSFPQYEPTPLHDLKNLSKDLGIGGVYIKDESYRFGLNAFKVLGGSYAIGRYIGQKLDLAPDQLDFTYLKTQEVKDKLGDVVFVTATDGNHGKGVAWAARELGQKSVVTLPKGSAQARLESIQKEGADAWITDVNYDDTVRLAKEYAKENKGIIIQDSVRPGYEEIPTWIMQGYTTIAGEVDEALDKPLTHIFLQAGVGAFAAAITAYFAGKFGENRPKIIIVEPDEAACFYLSMEEGGQEAKIVGGLMPTIMAGLACGEPCDLSWEILKKYGDFFISASDEFAAEGMRALAKPVEGDPQVVSGESGAVGLGLVKILMGDPEFKDIKEKLGLDENSSVLIISTEGDTDPENYKKIVG